MKHKKTEESIGAQPTNEMQEKVSKTKQNPRTTLPVEPIASGAIVAAKKKKRGDGKSGPKRDVIQVERDRAEIARLYLQGKIQTQIALILSESPDRDYNITQSMVCDDLKAVKQRWLTSSIMHFNEIKARELAKIDNLEIMYWESWKRSLDPKTKTRTKQINLASSSIRQEAQMEEQRSIGDKRWLEGVQWCIERRCSIFGLDAPKRVDIGSGSIAEAIPWDTLTIIQLRRLRDGEDPHKIIPGLALLKPAS